MEPDVMSEKLEWEARRVAAAFGVDAWESSEKENGFLRCRVDAVSCVIETTVPSLRTLCLYGTAGTYCDVWGSGRRGWSIFLRKSTSHLNELMAYGLYRLGFEDDAVLSQLPELSAHEKLELMLSLPREFWPQKWIDEERVSESESESGPLSHHD